MNREGGHDTRRCRAPPAPRTALHGLRADSRSPIGPTVLWGQSPGRGLFIAPTPGTPRTGTAAFSLARRSHRSIVTAGPAPGFTRGSSSQSCALRGLDSASKRGSLQAFVRRGACVGAAQTHPRLRRSFAPSPRHHCSFVTWFQRARQRSFAGVRLPPRVDPPGRQAGPGQRMSYLVQFQNTLVRSPPRQRGG